MRNCIIRNSLMGQATLLGNKTILYLVYVLQARGITVYTRYSAYGYYNQWTDTIK